MDILKRDLENKERLEQLVEMKLDDMGIADMDNGVAIRAAAKKYFVGMLQEHLNKSGDNIITEYFDNSELAIWGFIAGYSTKGILTM